MNENRIEPGLLAVLRLFIGVQVILLALDAMDDETPSRFARAQLVLSTILLVYVAWPRVRRWLGRFFLPVALIAVSVGPIVFFQVATAAGLRDGTLDADYLSDNGALFIWLFPPLMLVSAQYSMRVMTGYVVGTTVLDIVLAGILYPEGNPAVDQAIENALARLLLFPMVGYVMVRLMAAQRQQRAELAAANAQLAQHTTTQEQLIVSRERNRMARELHDTLAHTLSAVAVQLKALAVQLHADPDAAEATLVRTQQLTIAGLAETRRALQALRSNPVADLGLGLALNELVTSTGARTDMAVQLALPPDLADLRPDVQQNLYRIAEEAIANVVRHANAQHLTVALAQANGQLSLRVADDGAGFDPASHPEAGHFGLTGMRERAELCGGVLEIASAPGAGTTVTVTIGARHHLPAAGARRQRSPTESEHERSNGGDGL